jgi:hypothetical protein
MKRIKKSYFWRGVLDSETGRKELLLDGRGDPRLLYTRAEARDYRDIKDPGGKVVKVKVTVEVVA